MPIRGYGRIEDVRELQTKQFTSDLHRLSDSKRVVRRATHSMNTVESLKKVRLSQIRDRVKICKKRFRIFPDSPRPQKLESTEYRITSHFLPSIPEVSEMVTVMLVTS